MNRNQYELYHYGVKGMKWGRRRYQNKDGSLTSEGKKHVSDYKTAKSLHKKVRDEGNKLISSNPRLKKDFGGRDKWDDEEFLSITAQGYGINTDSFSKAIVDNRNFRKQNKKSIDKGKKIVAKYGIDISDPPVTPQTVKKPGLTDRAAKAFKDNPGLTYDKIYKDMKVDMNSDDTSVYKQAEDEWLKRHGY